MGTAMVIKKKPECTAEEETNEGPLQQLIKNHSNIFEDSNYTPGHVASVCVKCGHIPWNGWGSPMCVHCSVVDKLSYSGKLGDVTQGYYSKLL